MPLTARDGYGATLDATDCTDAQWAEVHRVKPRPALACRACHAGMHAKVSPAGLRFFAHDRKVATCSDAGETPEHRRLKARLAEAVRSVGGWAAVVEAQPAISDAGGWRADVLATGPGGRRVAFEAQLATMTLDEGRQRSARYAIDDIDTVWVTTRDAPWVYKLAGIKLSEDDSAEIDGQARRLVVRRGCAQLEEGQLHRWRPRVGLDLRRVVGGVLSGRVVRHAVEFLSEVVEHGAGERCRLHEDAVVLAPVAHAARDRRHRLVEAARRSRELQDQARHVKSIEDLYARQQRLVPLVAADAAQLAGPGESLWLGVPPSRVAEAGKANPKAALGSAATAMGAVIWLGATRGNLRLFAVVCPVAGRITQGLARSWQRRGTRVYVENVAEARRVGLSLGWPLDGLIIRGAIHPTSRRHP